MRVFEASCIAGIVTANGAVVPSCPIVGDGGNSSGYLVMSEGDLFYLPKATPDVSSLIDLVESICDKIVAVTVTSASPGSPTSTPLNATDFVAIKAELAILKSSLK